MRRRLRYEIFGLLELLLLELTERAHGLSALCGRAAHWAARRRRDHGEPHWRSLSARILDRIERKAEERIARVHPSAEGEHPTSPTAAKREGNGSRNPTRRVARERND